MLSMHINDNGTIKTITIPKFMLSEKLIEHGNYLLNVHETDAVCPCCRATNKVTSDTKVNAPNDIIQKPAHYHKGGMDVIEFMSMKLPPEQMEGFFLVNAIKYLVRYQDKGKPLEDLKKASFYVNKLIEMKQEPK